MLKSLIIKNYALIEDLNVEFDSGFTVITGETGAGKSIVLSALDLVLGRRADAKVMRDPQKKCIVEAHFDVSHYDLTQVFKRLELDYDHVTILRREIWPSGKSRAFVNDSPTSLSQIQELKKHLVEIHHQGEAENLYLESFQLDLIDTMAGAQGQLIKYRGDFTHWQKLIKERQELVDLRQRALQEEDYQNFILNELTALDLDQIDQDDLEQQQNLLTHQELIQNVIQEVSVIVGQDDLGLMDQLTKVRQRLSQIDGVTQDLGQLSERIEAMRIELADIQSSLDRQLDRIEHDPQQAQNIENLLDGLYRLQKKHGMDRVEDLIDLRENLSQRLSDSSQTDDRIAVLTAEIDRIYADLNEQANLIHQTRLAAIPKLENKLLDYFRALSLPEARISFRIERTDQLNIQGGVACSFWFSANKGIDLRPIQKVASGGETSRVVLSVKAVSSDFKQLPTLIFDEIDTGISGETAAKMADILAQMSTRGQLFCLTHLPQTAAKGRFHKRIFKRSDGDRTKTFIEDLGPQDRVLEIAQMIGGQDLTDSAKAHARQLLN
ncbi:MAG: DNA repair protein RecN [Flavobacteriaceae bacterium]